MRYLAAASPVLAAMAVVGFVTKTDPITVMILMVGMVSSLSLALSLED